MHFTNAVKGRTI